jgi:hypothetical protein
MDVDKGSLMFKAVFVYTISIKHYDEVLDRPWKKCRYKMEKEFRLPFVPVQKSLFTEGDDEYSVDYAHYDLLSGKFVVDCGGGLCSDEQDVQEALDYQLSKGWTVACVHPTDSQTP